MIRGQAPAIEPMQIACASDDPVSAALMSLSQIACASGCLAAIRSRMRRPTTIRKAATLQPTANPSAKSVVMSGSCGCMAGVNWKLSRASTESFQFPQNSLESFQFRGTLAT